MEITWDDRKEAENIKKHGVAFDEAATVILNSLSLYRINKHQSRKRFEYIGYSDHHRVLYVVTVEAYGDNVHILSAREAGSHERKEYEEGR